MGTQLDWTHAEAPRWQDQRGVTQGRLLGVEPDLDEEDYLQIDDAEIVDDALEASIRRLCCSPWSLHPKPSSVELECLQLTTFKDVKTAAMTRRFKRQRSLEERVLHEVRQPYHLGSSIRSMGHALSIVGVTGLRQPLLEASLRREVFHGAASDTTLGRLFRHSLAVAMIAESIAGEFSQEPSAMWEAALFHDVGVTVAFRQLLAEREALGVSSREEMSIGLASVRGALTVECAENWRVGNTAHGVLVDLDRSLDAVDLHPGVPVVVLAEQLAMRCGYGVGVGDVGFDPHEAPNILELSWARNVLEIGSAAMESLERRGREVLATLP